MTILLFGVPTFADNYVKVGAGFHGALFFSELEPRIRNEEALQRVAMQNWRRQALPIIYLPVIAEAKLEAGPGAIIGRFSGARQSETLTAQGGFFGVGSLASTDASISYRVKRSDFELLYEIPVSEHISLVPLIGHRTWSRTYSMMNLGFGNTTFSSSFSTVSTWQDQEVNLSGVYGGMEVFIIPRRGKDLTISIGYSEGKPSGDANRTSMRMVSEQFVTAQSVEFADYNSSARFQRFRLGANLRFKQYFEWEIGYLHDRMAIRYDRYIPITDAGIASVDSIVTNNYLQGMTFNEESSGIYFGLSVLVAF